MSETTTWSCDCHEGDDFAQRPVALLRCGECGAIRPPAPPPAATRTEPDVTARIEKQADAIAAELWPEPDHSLAVAYAKNVLEGTTLFGPSPDGLLNFARAYLSLVPSVPVPGSEGGGADAELLRATIDWAYAASNSFGAAHKPEDSERCHAALSRLAALRAPALGEAARAAAVRAVGAELWADGGVIGKALRASASSGPERDRMAHVLVNAAIEAMEAHRDART